MGKILLPLSIKREKQHNDRKGHNKEARAGGGGFDLILLQVLLKTDF
jgi:hypothetical protein